MSGRGASVDVIAELAKGANQPAHLFELQFDVADGGTLYLTDSYRAISYGGNSYSAAGHLLSFSSLTESAELRITDLRAQLSGVDQTMIAQVLNKQYLDRHLVIYKAFFDVATQALIVDPIAIHNGRMDEPLIQEDPVSGSSVVQITSHDQFADFERRSGRHTNPADQNLYFPTDRAFDLVAQNAGKQTTLMWGVPRPGGPAPSGGGGGVISVLDLMWSPPAG